MLYEMIDPKLFRDLLGKAADDLTDADVEHVLDWAIRFSDASIEWWKREYPLPLSVEEALFDARFEEYRSEAVSQSQRVWSEDDYWHWRCEIEAEKYA